MILKYETKSNKGIIFDAARIVATKEIEAGPPSILIERTNGSIISLLYDTIEQRDEWYERLKNQVYTQTYVDKVNPDKVSLLELLKIMWKKWGRQNEW